MRLGTRKMMDKAFSAAGITAVVFMVAALVVLLGPIIIRGAGAVFFTGTVEHRRLMLEVFGRGDEKKVEGEIQSARNARKTVYDAINGFEKELESADSTRRMKYRKPLKDLNKCMAVLFGPAPGSPNRLLMRDQYGQTRWDRTRIKLHAVLFRETWDYSDPSKSGKQVFVPRRKEFEGTPLEEIFPYIENNIEKMMLPRKTFYRHFFTDKSYDSHFFGGIWAEMLGTFYLAIGTMIFAVPFGVIAAIYLAEYAHENRFLTLLRTCISTLAGVPSIVFGLFGLAFFINTVGVSQSKSVLAGCLTLALMVLPTIIRASEEAIKAVPRTYKEAALSLGAGRWHTIMTVILPAALPGILTGIVISMGRAAGETAPIIFTAAVSVGKSLNFLDIFSQPTPALSWNIYNLATEHEAVDEIRHVQYGLVLALVGIVLLLNTAGIILRARFAKKLKA